MIAVVPASARPTETGSVSRARVAAERLSHRLERDEYEGWDPYDALSSPLLQWAARTPLLRQVAIQSLKRAPLNVRPLFRIPKRRHTKALALLISAYTRMQRPDLALRLRDLLLDRALRGGGWGYDFDVQTRWGYYPAGQANAVVTAFGAHALMDALELEEDSGVRTELDRALGFATRELLAREGDDYFFAYFAGGEVPIHNANLLIASAFARTNPTGRDQARAAVQYTLDRQRPDGTWPYGERRGLEWVDGFHTAYVLERLAEWHAAEPDPVLADCIERGTEAYVQRLIDVDGAPRATLDRRYPLDIHAAASAITALCRLEQFHARARETARVVLEWALANMARGDGRFSFQQHRRWTNRMPYVRWNDAHMLLALSTYASTSEGA